MNALKYYQMLKERYYNVKFFKSFVFYLLVSFYVYNQLLIFWYVHLVDPDFVSTASVYCDPMANIDITWGESLCMQCRHLWLRPETCGY